MRSIRQLLREQLRAAFRRSEREPRLLAPPPGLATGHPDWRRHPRAGAGGVAAGARGRRGAAARCWLPPVSASHIAGDLPGKRLGRSADAARRGGRCTALRRSPARLSGRGCDLVSRPGAVRPPRPVARSLSWLLRFRRQGLPRSGTYGCAGTASISPPRTASSPRGWLARGAGRGDPALHTGRSRGGRARHGRRAPVLSPAPRSTPSPRRRRCSGATFTRRCSPRSRPGASSAQVQYEVAVFHHGIYVPQGLIGECCREAGVRVVNWNPAYRKQCFIFSHGDTYHHTLMTEPTEQLGEHALVQPAGGRPVEVSGKPLERHPGLDLVSRSPHRGPAAHLAERSAWTSTRPCIGLLTNVMWDAQLHYPANAFPNMLEWVLSTIEYFARRPELQLLIRVHPAELRGSLASRQPIVAEIRRRFPSLPPNVFVDRSREPGEHLRRRCLAATRCSSMAPRPASSSPASASR